MKNIESGRSMIEMLGVLAIVGVLSVGGLAGYAQAMQKYKVYKVTSQVAGTMQNVIKFYSNSETFDSLSTMAKKEKLNLTAFEYSKVDGSTKLLHAFGGEAQVTECSRKASGDKLAFCITLQNVEPKGCAELMERSWGGRAFAIGAISSGSFDESQYLDLAANAGQVKKEGATTVAYGSAIPLEIKDAATACVGANNIFFVKVK